MSLLLKICAIIIGVAMLLRVASALKHKKLNDTEGVFWIFAALVLIVLSVFPWLIGWTADIFGIQWPPAVLIFAMVIVVFFIAFNHSKEITILKAQSAELGEQMSLLKEELERLKKTESAQSFDKDSASGESKGK